jgi:pimeloyl-ACP methyl ester carboxylesterase
MREGVPSVKPTLLLLPGLLCDRALWAAQIRALSEVCDPWVADLTRDETMDGMARRALEEVPAHSFAMAGLSMGGYVAMEIMRQAPERVARLALLDTRARLDAPEDTERRLQMMRLAESERGFAPITTRMLPLLVHPSRVADSVLVDAIRGMAERIGISAYLRQQRAIMSRVDFRSVLSQVSCPTLVLCGREDVLTPLPLHVEMEGLVAGARLSILEQCGHMSTMERPHEVNEELRLWLTADQGSNGRN